MKIIFNKNDMCEAVSPLQSGVSGKTALTATEGILFEAQAPDVCRMTTFDLEKGVRLSVRVEVIEEGAAIISAAKFSQTVRAMEDGEITLSVDDRNCVSITCGRASHTMNALPAADFPDLPRLRSVNGFTVPRKTLRTMIGKCMHAMGTNDQRPFLNGMYMRVTDGRLDTVACDSFRMAVCSTPAETENRNESGDALNYRFILPNKSVGELFRLLDYRNEKSEKSLESSESGESSILFHKFNVLLKLCFTMSCTMYKFNSFLILNSIKFLKNFAEMLFFNFSMPYLFEVISFDTFLN